MISHIDTHTAVLILYTLYISRKGVETYYPKCGLLKCDLRNCPHLSPLLPTTHKTKQKGNQICLLITSCAIIHEPLSKGE